MPKKTKSTSDLWNFAEKILGSDNVHTVYAWGPPGIGKTYTACRSGLNEREFYSITLTPETPAAELRGFFMPKGKEFIWQDGVFIKAMREGARVVINEVSHASHDVIAILYPVLESVETAALTLPNTETVRPADGFQVICTDNAPPDQLPDALKDRFDATLHIDEPHPAALDRLRPEFREAAIKTMALEDGRGVSMRGWLAVQKLQEEFGIEDAFKAVFGKERGRALRRSVKLGAAA